MDILLYKHASELFDASSFHEEIVFSLQNRLAARGFGCNIVPVRDVEDFDAYARRVQSFVIGRLLPYRYLETIERADKPVVTLNFSSPLTRSTAVVVEHRAIDALCRHLVDLGHSRIAFVKRPGFHLGQEERLLRFRTFMEMAEITDNCERVFELEPSDEDTAGRLLRELTGCTAVMAADDFLAIKVRHLAMSARVAVPEDLSLTGHGNLSITRSLYPTLTTADVDREALCAAVVEAVEEGLARRGRSETRRLASYPVVRFSTANANPVDHRK